MKTLLLLRHAKSDWGDAALDDHDRTLNPRGTKAAPRMGELLRDENLLPDHCLSSTAVRAQQTAELVMQASGANLEIVYLDDLYTFGDGSKIAECIAAHGQSAERLLVVCHNPAVQAFTMRMCEEGAPAPMQHLYEKYPTAGLAVIAFDIDDWSQLPTSKGFLKAFWRPRDLM